MHSDIHVLVRFHEQSVFAGEELRCTITFRNVANVSEPATRPRQSSRRESIGHIAAQIAKGHAPHRSNHAARPSQHEITPDLARHPRPSGSSTSPQAGFDDHRSRSPRAKQQRSVSIISVTSPIAGEVGDSTASSWAKQQRLSHQRSHTTGNQYDAFHQGQRRLSPTGLHLPPGRGRHSPLSPERSKSRETTPEFKFPLEQPKTRRHRPQPSENPSLSGFGSSKPSNSRPQASERSSGEFYSLSNHSQETLMSEQPSILSEIRTPLNYPATQHPRRPPLRPQQRPQAVNLLMGYAQLSATFTLDASLIDQSHFEEVKNKGFLGGQAGGGVVGIKKPRPTSGFLGGFNFNSIGDSLNTLMGGDNMSSVKEMHAVTNSRAIPLLSTPQSLLFVDLHLEPGDEKSYTFTYPLPHGLPSSHRGKAIKISYNLTIGVQGLPGSRDTHTVRQINVPVRVFSGVNLEGEILGHDLMQPHVILRDLAATKSISSPDDQDETQITSSQQAETSTIEFLKFVDRLLDRHRRRQSSSGTLEAFQSGQDAHDHRKSVQAISRAIHLGNQLGESEASSNRFEIARNGLRVAVIVIDRPLHRLGETVTAVVDFSESEVPCATLHSTLETSEKVSPSLAVRSAATISRVTRKTYLAKSENVLFSQRATFAPAIPGSGTPTFVTTGVSLDWCLRFEFGTIKFHEAEDGEPRSKTELLEEVIKDERGTINVAVENLDCETFDVVIPFTVYGDVVPDGKEGDEIVGIPI
ncbi:hypothetical protein B0A52_00304 [Exophiala mesophila]|uniref:Rgp1-domain-containing protein n=1 Tax=Exophiala mesophila TaxID=212818 RepID=A0A438NJM9_EXOME|nr:hypothetical protein B0A52_00304 [Exophiala mesophila]